MSGERRWPLAAAMLVAPTLVLGTQTLVYALTPTACSLHRPGWLHAVHAVALFVVALLAATPAMQWRAAEGEQGFLVRVALGVGAIAVAVELALWLPTWVLSPCLG